MVFPKNIDFNKQPIGAVKGIDADACAGKAGQSHSFVKRRGAGAGYYIFPQ
jgi:hypothetical protein